jgi:hypothetical protein
MDGCNKAANFGQVAQTRSDPCDWICRVHRRIVKEIIHDASMPIGAETRGVSRDDLALRYTARADEPFVGWVKPAIICRNPCWVAPTLQIRNRCRAR